MKLTGYSVVWREKFSDQWKFCTATTYEDSDISAVVFASDDEALNFMAEQGFEVDDEVQIVEVTLNTRRFKC